MSAPDLTADELTIPKKRTTGETLAERLTSNAYHNILPARYLRRDSDGELTETQEELFVRVARNVALAEAVYEADRLDVELTVTPDQVKPNHPRRDELAAAVFGPGTTVEDDVETVLTEHNVNKFAWETVVPALPDAVREHVEAVAAEFQEQMEQLSFTPNSPTLMNAGDELQQLSACFVDSPGDDLSDIHKTAMEAAEVFQCLTAESTVVTEADGIVSVADLEVGDRVLQQRDVGFRFQPVEAVHRYDDAPTLTVDLANGRSIRGTPNHRIMVEGRWRRLDEIHPGDRVHYTLGWIRDADREVPELAAVEPGPRWTNSRTVDNEDILALYQQGLSDYEIADRLECGKSTVQRRRVEELELPPNGSGGRKPGSTSFDEAAALDFHEAGYTDSAIADQLDVSPTAIVRLRGRNGLQPNGTPVKSVSQPTRLSEDLAELIGLWVGDGSWHEDGVRFHVRRESVAEYVEHLTEQLFETTTSSTYADGCYELCIDSHEIKRWWAANFDSKPDGALSARVPEVVTMAPASVVEAFLRGLFTADGTLLDETYPKLYSSSEQLIDDVGTLMLGLGYPVKRTVIRDEDAHPYYGLVPTTGQGRRAFLREVGFIDERQEVGLANIRSVAPRDSFSIGDEYTVEVESVTESAPATVYDVTVAEDPEYVTDGIVSHNSGGGMGYAFWRLRPYGDPVGSTGGIASGPITFMETFDRMCFVPGTKVLTPNGTVPIEQIEPGQLVIDENGDELPVTETMRRTVDEDIVEVVPERINNPIRVTDEHPIKVAREDGFEWVDADDLQVGDDIVLGCAVDDNGLDLDGHLDLTTIGTGPLVFTDGGIVVNREYYDARKGATPQQINDEVPVDDFAKIAGWYLAEGCVVYLRGVPSSVCFTLNSAERDAAMEIQEALFSFGVESRIDVIEERNTLNVIVENSSFAQFIHGVFGTGAADKRVPPVLWQSPPEVQAQVLKALFAGDGRLQKRGKSQRVQLKLANQRIIDFVCQVGLRCGAPFSRHNRSPENRLPTASASLSVSTAIGTPLESLFDEVPDDFEPRDRTRRAHGRNVVRVRSVETVPYSGHVHNLEVAETNTYVAEDIVVHNCETIAQGGTRRGAQMAIMRVSHPDVIEFIHAKNKDVSLAHSLRLNDPDDYTYTSFSEALEEARSLIDEEGRVPKHLRNAVEGHLSNFNVSVGVTDEFMEALKNDEDYTFVSPRTGEPHIATEYTEEMYARYGLDEYVTPGEVLTLPASVLWERIVQGAWENGEPGVVYLDRINQEHSFPVESTPTGDGSEYEILATNPCVAEGTLVNSPDGYRKVEDIAVGDEISTVLGSEPVEEIEVHENYPVYRVTFSDGGALDVTSQHQFHVIRQGSDSKQITPIPLNDVEPGDYVRLHPSEIAVEGNDAEYDRGLKCGILIGDGNFTETALDLNRVTISTSVEDEEYNQQVKALFGEDGFRADDPHSEGKAKKLVLSDGGTVVQELELEPAMAPDKSFDPTELTTEAEVMGVLDGLLATDGNINLYSNHPQIRWDTASEQLAQDVRRALLSVGIHGRISVITDPKRGGSINGRKISANHPKYTVNVSGSSARRYAEKSRIGELHPEKGEQLHELLTGWMTTGNTWKARVESVEKLDERTTVYDLYCSGSDTWITDGYVQRGCGEQPLMEYEACNLGHINLSTIAALDGPDWRVWADRHADEHADLGAAVETYLEEAIDLEELDHRIAWSTRFLENVVTMSDFPVEQIEETVFRNRKIGLGVMGLAQLYVQLGVRYGSDVGNEIVRQLMMRINHGSKWTSHELALERGSFANWADSKYADPVADREWFEHQTGLDADAWADGFPIRNHNTTTVAPTGTTSMVGNTTGGIEPIYNVAYYKNVSDDVQGDEMLVEFDDYFLRVLEANDIDVAAVKAEALDQMERNAFAGVGGLETVPAAIGDLFVVTGDVTAEEHASVQCAAQAGVDSAISKTVNAPNDSTVDDAKSVFEYIYDHGGKGVTYYRDGTRSKQVLTTRAQNADFADLDEAEAAEVLLEQIEALFGGLEGFLDHEDVRSSLAEELEAVLETGSHGTATKQPRPDVLYGVTQRIETGYGKLYVNINEDEQGRPFELFANIGNSGGFTASFTEALAKTISTALRSGVDPRELASELSGIRSPKVAWDKGEQIQSIPDAIGTAMRRYLDGEVEKAYPQQRNLGEIAEEGDRSEPESDGGRPTADDATQSLIDAGESPECPSCGSLSLYYSEGCTSCEACGWSEC